MVEFCITDVSYTLLILHASTPLASGMAANHHQVGSDHLFIPSWSGTVLPGRCACPRFIHQRQVAAADSRQRDTRRTTYKDCDPSVRLCCVGLSDMERPPRRSADFNSVCWDIHTLPLSGTHFLTAFGSVNLCQLSGNTLKLYFKSAFPGAPCRPNTPAPQIQFLIFWRFINSFTYLLTYLD